MFYIRKRSIQSGHAGAFAAHLLQTGSDVHMGMAENSGYESVTTFLGATPHVDEMVQGVAAHFYITVGQLMDYYMDIADGHEGFTNKDRALIKAIASYKPE